MKVEVEASKDWSYSNRTMSLGDIHPVVFSARLDGKWGTVQTGWRWHGVGYETIWGPARHHVDRKMEMDMRKMAREAFTKAGFPKVIFLERDPEPTGEEDEG